MLLPDLVRIVQVNADALAAELMQGLREDPRAPYLRAVGDDELQRLVLDVYRNCARWAAAAGRRAASEQEDLERAYADLGRARRAEGVAASQVVHALGRAKWHLLEFIRRNAAADSSIELYQETELERMIHRFFDTAVYWVLRGHEGTAGGEGPNKP